MKHTDTIQAKTTINAWLKNKTLKIADYLELAKSMDGYGFLDEFLIFAVSKCNIKYNKLPSNKKFDLEFLRKLCKERVTTIKEISKANKVLLSKLVVNFSSKDVHELSGLLKDKQIDKIIALRESLMPDSFRVQA